MNYPKQLQLWPKPVPQTKYVEHAEGKRKFARLRSMLEVRINRIRRERKTP